MNKKEILEFANTELLNYSENFTPNENIHLPVTVYQKDWLTIEDRRPDITEEDAKKLGYKYKILINGTAFHILNAFRFESLMNIMIKYEEV